MIIKCVSLSTWVHQMGDDGSDGTTQAGSSCVSGVIPDMGTSAHCTTTGYWLQHHSHHQCLLFISTDLLRKLCLVKVKIDTGTRVRSTSGTSWNSTKIIWKAIPIKTSDPTPAVSNQTLCQSSKHLNNWRKVGQRHIQASKLMSQICTGIFKLFLVKFSFPWHKYFDDLLKHKRLRCNLGHEIRMFGELEKCYTKVE